MSEKRKMYAEEWREAVVVAALVAREGGRVELSRSEIAALYRTDVTVYDDVANDCVVISTKTRAEKFGTPAILFTRSPTS